MKTNPNLGRSDGESGTTMRNRTDARPGHCVPRGRNHSCYGLPAPPSLRRFALQSAAQRHPVVSCINTLRLVFLAAPQCAGETPGHAIGCRWTEFTAVMAHQQLLPVTGAHCSLRPSGTPWQAEQTASMKLSFRSLN